MTPEHWARVEQLYHAAAGRSREQREGWLRHECAGDDVVRREVESLLAQNASSDDLLETPAFSPLAVNDGSLIGQRISNFEILALIDEGGMGQVYRARDLTLPRDVAIKVIPAAVSHDPVRRARFRQEAELLASLSHPHIAHVHAFVADGSRALLVMELVPGRTLAERIARGPLPVAEALPIARQIADALDAAHEQGVVHRDLKPANVKITPDGVVKVLDFGLARPVRRAGSTAAPIHDEGPLFGTAAYLSPEQARGESVDRRGDIWAFGCVLFEMLTGRQAFSGATVTEILTAILERDPDWSMLPSSPPDGVHALLRRCLDKDPRRRLRDIGEARVALDHPITEERRPAPVRKRPGLRAVLLGAGAALTLMIGGITLWRSTSSGVEPVRPRIEFTIETPPGEEMGTSATEDPVPVAAPDGTRLLFRTGGRQNARWWIRPIDSATAIPLPVAGKALLVRWSPDSAHVTWCADNALWIATVAGGAATKVTDGCLSTNGHPSWGSKETLIFNGTAPAGLLVVPVAGGPARQITTVDVEHGEVYHGYPSFLPDGTHYVFLVNGSNRDGVGIYLGDVASDRRSRLVAERSRPVVIERPDHGADLMFVQRGSLVVQPIDVEGGRLAGEPRVIASRIALGLTGFDGAYSASDRLLAYRSGGNQRNDEARLRWFDRQGAQTGELDLPTDNAGAISTLSLSADEQQLLLSRFARDTNTIDIWNYDIRRGVAQRLLHDDFVSFDAPEWARNGKSFLYSMNETGLWVVHERQTTGTDRVLVPGVPYQYAANGRFFLGIPPFATKGLSMFAFDVARRTSMPVPRPGAGAAALSPDGRWLAVSSSASGQSVIYVQPYLSGMPVRVSTGGGDDPRWRADGRELYYLNDDSWVVAVPFDGKKDAPTIGTPTPLFRVPIARGTQLVPVIIHRSRYAPSADGQRFLISVPVGEPQPTRVVTNWRETLSR